MQYIVFIATQIMIEMLVSLVDKCNNTLHLFCRKVLCRTGLLVCDLSFGSSFRPDNMKQVVIDGGKP